MATASSEQSNPLEFVMFLERNTKENELFIFYLQWTGNEEALTKFEAIINKAKYEEMFGDYVILALDTDIKFPESAVNLHCSNKYYVNCYFRLFSKCSGRFTYFDKPNIITKEQNDYKLARLLDSDFNTCKIQKMFVPF